MAWDNVVFKSEMLGYVVATHQTPQMNPTKTVITYYWPLTHLSPAEARRETFSRPIKEWQKIILGELFKIHPELKGSVKHLDMWLWGHAMINQLLDLFGEKTEKLH